MRPEERAGAGPGHRGPAHWGGSRGRGSRLWVGGRTPPPVPQSSPSGSPAGEQTTLLPRARGVPPVKRAPSSLRALNHRPGRTIRKNNVCAFPEKEHEAAAASWAVFLGPDVTAPRLRPFHTHVPPLCDPGPWPLEKCPGQGAAGAALLLHTPCRRRPRGAGAGEAQGGRGGGKRRPAAGEGRAADAQARNALGGRRLCAAAGRGSLEARPARGQSRELHEVPPGLRTGRCPGEAVGEPPTSMARRGPRRRARSKSGSGAGAEGRGPELGRGDSGHGEAKAGLSRCQSAAPPRITVEPPTPRRSAPWLFWKLANVFVEKDGGGEGGSEGVTETELEAAGRTEAKAGGARDRLTDRQTDRASRPQARSSGAGARRASVRGRGGDAGGGGGRDGDLRGLKGWELAARPPKVSVSLQSWDFVPKLHAPSGSK